MSHKEAQIVHPVALVGCNSHVQISNVTKCKQQACCHAKPKTIVNMYLKAETVEGTTHVQLFISHAWPCSQTCLLPHGVMNCAGGIPCVASAGQAV
jgi:hypothetical protein